MALLGVKAGREAIDSALSAPNGVWPRSLGNQQA